MLPTGRKNLQCGALWTIKNSGSRTRKLCPLQLRISSSLNWGDHAVIGRRIMAATVFFASVIFLQFAIIFHLESSFFVPLQPRDTKLRLEAYYGAVTSLNGEAIFRRFVTRISRVHFNMASQLSGYKLLYGLLLTWRGISTNLRPYSTFNFGLCDLRWFYAASQSIGCSTVSVVSNSGVAIMLMRLSILFDIFSLPQSGPDKHVWSSLNFKWPSWTNSNKKPLATWSPCVNNSTSNGQRNIRLLLRLLNLN